MAALYDRQLRFQSTARAPRSVFSGARYQARTNTTSWVQDLAWNTAGGTRAWISLSYEPGVRSYPAFDTNPVDREPSLFSDYSYHRLSLFANVRIARSLTFSAFIDYPPEDHKREGDDTTVTLVSLELTSAF
jgi:hypothetical protein